MGNRVVAERLRQAGVDVRIHDDHVGQDARDNQWLPFAGQQGWLVVTEDKRIRQRETERNALLDGGVAAFVITKGDINACVIDFTTFSGARVGASSTLMRSS